MKSWLVRTFADPNVERWLLRDEGEMIVDEVRHHWVVYLKPALEALAGLGFAALFLFAPVDLAWMPLLVALALFAHAGYRALTEHMDRFVVTNHRVFRVHGVISRTQATMPLRRILDITVEVPLPGRLVNFGHLVFESAAQEQGLRDIRYVSRPEDRGLVIQRVVQRSGLGGRA